MRLRDCFAAKCMPALAATLLGVLAGCGGEEHVSEEEFLASVRQSNVTGETGGGTIPPLGSSMDQVARIRVETDELHVGVIANDKLHRAKLKVYNDGKMPLKLTRVDTTCACTQGIVAPERAQIPPGGESWIDVVIDPYRIPGFHSRKVLTITSTDPARSQVEVGVTAEVDPEYALETEELAVGDLNKGESVEKRIRWRQIQEAPIALGEIEKLTGGPNGPLIFGVEGRVEAIPEASWEQPGRPEYDIVLNIGPELPAGPFERRVFVELKNLPRLKSHRIDITGNVLAPYRVTPGYPVRAQLMPDGQAGNLRVQIDVAAESPVVLSDVGADAPGLTFAVIPGATPNETALAVTLSGDAVSQPLDTAVRFQVQVDGTTYNEFAAVRAGAPGAAAATPSFDAGHVHTPGDGHDH